MRASGVSSEREHQLDARERRLADLEREFAVRLQRLEEREIAAELREQRANERESLADRREHDALVRERSLDQRDARPSPGPADPGERMDEAFAREVARLDRSDAFLERSRAAVKRAQDRLDSLRAIRNDSA
jgi:hypothetical protein